ELYHVAWRVYTITSTPRPRHYPYTTLFRSSPRGAGRAPGGPTLLRVSDRRHGAVRSSGPVRARTRPARSAHPLDADPGAGSDLLEAEHPADRRRDEPGRHRPAPPHDDVADAVAVLVDDLQRDDRRGPATHRPEGRLGVRGDPLEARRIGPAAGRRPGCGVVHDRPQHRRGVQPDHHLQRAVEEQQEHEEADRGPDDADPPVAAPHPPGPPPD